METKHTPGPWKVNHNIGRKSELGITADNAPCIIATMCNAKAWPVEAEANARLIAAAPDLLLQLKQAHGIIRRLTKLVRHYGYADEIPQLREKPRKAAIALAEKGA